MTKLAVAFRNFANAPYYIGAFPLYCCKEFVTLLKKLSKNGPYSSGCGKITDGTYTAYGTHH
jgi:hypothetical protein